MANLLSNWPFCSNDLMITSECKKIYCFFNLVLQRQLETFCKLVSNPKYIPLQVLEKKAAFFGTCLHIQWGLSKKKNYTERDNNGGFACTFETNDAQEL